MGVWRWHRWVSSIFRTTTLTLGVDAKKDPLVSIDAVVPWEEFRPTLEQVWRKPRALVEFG